MKHLIVICYNHRNRTRTRYIIEYSIYQLIDRLQYKISDNQKPLDGEYILYCNLVNWATGSDHTTAIHMNSITNTEEHLCTHRIGRTNYMGTQQGILGVPTPITNEYLEIFKLFKS